MAQPSDIHQTRPDLAVRAAGMPRGHDGRFTPQHGAYSLAGRLGDDAELDRRRRDVRAYLDFRSRLVRDLTGEEEESGLWPPQHLSAQQQSLVAETAFLEAVTDAIRLYALAHGTVRRGGRLPPVLADHYITWAEAKRRHLMTLGLTRRGKTKQLADIRREGGS